MTPTPSLSHPTAWLLRLCLGLSLCAALAACGGSIAPPPPPPKPVVQGAPPPAPPLRAEGDDAEAVRAEIDRIQRRIARERAEAEPTANVVEQQATSPNAPNAPAAYPDAPRCSPDTCDAAEGVCASAQTVCAIAARHPNDADFTQSCQWAEARCADASTQCAACQAATRP